jgi:hypothetical protein
MYGPGSAAMSAPTLAIKNIERRSRLTTLFRLIIAVPWNVVSLLWGFAAFVCVIVAWFALLFKGRYPAALYQFVASFARFNTRVYAFTYLLADPFPPLDGDEHPEYPVALQLGLPPAAYSRWKVLLRILYIVPAYIVFYIASIAVYIVGFISWLVITITGRQPDALEDILKIALAWYVRYLLLFTLITETYTLKLV